MSDAKNEKIILGMRVDGESIPSDMAKAESAVVAGAKKIAEGVKGAGDVFGPVTVSAEKAEKSVTRITKSISDSIQREIFTKTAGAKGTADYYEAWAKYRGVPEANIASHIASLRELERAQAASADQQRRTAEVQKMLSRERADAAKAVSVAESGSTAALTAATSRLNEMGMTAKGTAAALRQVPAQFTDIIISLQGGQAPLTVLLQQGGQLKDVFGGVGNAARVLSNYVAGLVSPFTLAAAAAATLGYSYYAGSKEMDGYKSALLETGGAAGVTASQLQAMAKSMGDISGTQTQAAEALTALARTGSVATENLRSFATTTAAFAKESGTAIDDIASKFKELSKDPLAASLRLNDSINYLTVSLYEQIKALEAQGKHTEAAALAQTAYANELDRQTSGIVGNLGLIERGWRAVKNETLEVWDFMKGLGRSDGLVVRVSKQATKVAEKQVDLDGATGYDVRVRAEELRIEQEKLATLQKRMLLEENVALSQRQQAEQMKATVEYDKLTEKSKSSQVKMVDEIVKLYNLGLEAGKTELQIAKEIEAIIAREQKPKKEKKEQIDADTRAYAEYIKYLQKGIDKTVELTEAEKAEQFIKGNLKAQLPANAELIRAKAAELDGYKKAEEQLKASLKALKEYNQEQAKILETRQKAADSAEAQLQKYQTEEQAVKLAADQNISLAQAIAMVDLARLKENQTKVLGEGADGATLLALQREIAARETLVGLIGNRADREAATKAAKDAAKEWKRTSDEINRALTDSLMRAFESGEGFGEAFAKTTEALFKTMVLRPTISAMMNPVSQGVNSMMGSAATSFAGSQMGIFAAGASGAFKAGLSSAFSGAAMETASSGLTMVAEAQGISSAVAGLSQTLGAIAPYALAAYAIYSMLKGGEYVKSSGDADATYSAQGTLTSQNTLGSNNFTMVRNATADAIVAGLQTGYMQAAIKLGIGTAATSFSYGSNNSDDGKFALGGASGASSFYQGETALTNESLALAASRAVFAALKGSELPGYMAKVFDQITTGTATQQQIDSAIAFAGSLKEVRYSLLSAAEQSTQLQSEVDKAFASLGTSASTFKVDFIKAIDSGITPDQFASWQALGGSMDKLASMSTTAAATVDDLAVTIKKAFDKLKSDSTSLGADLLRAQGFGRKADFAAMGLTEATASAEVVALYNANEATRALIKTLTDQAAAAQAAADATQSVTDGLVSAGKGLQDEYNRLTMMDAQYRTTQIAGLTALQVAQYDTNTAIQSSIDKIRAIKQAVADTAAAYTAAVAAVQSATQAAAASYQSFITAVTTAQAGLDSARSAITAQYLSSVTAKAAADKVVADAQAAVTDGYVASTERVKTAQQKLIDLNRQMGESMHKLGADLHSFIASLSTTDIAGATPAEQYAALKNQFGAQAALARGGDTVAAAGLPAIATALLKVSKDNSATSVDFMRDVGNVKNTISEVATAADAKATIAATIAAVDPIPAAMEDLAAALKDQEKWSDAITKSGAKFTVAAKDVLDGYNKAVTEQKAAADLVKTWAAAAQLTGSALVDTGKTLVEQYNTANTALKSAQADLVAANQIKGGLELRQTSALENFTKQVGVLNAAVAALAGATVAKASAAAAASKLPGNVYYSGGSDPASAGGGVATNQQVLDAINASLAQGYTAQEVAAGAANNFGANAADIVRVAQAGGVSEFSGYIAASGGTLAQASAYSAQEIVSAIQTSLSQGYSVEDIYTGATSNFGVARDEIQRIARSAGIPGFKVGTNYIPYDNYPAMLHEGEAVVPKAYNPAAGGGNNDRLMAEMVAELKALREEVRAGDAANVSATKSTTRILRDVTQGGTSISTVAAS